MNIEHIVNKRRFTMPVLPWGESPDDAFTTSPINCWSWSYGSISAGKFNMRWFLMDMNAFIIFLVLSSFLVFLMMELLKFR